jgi:hypothetical protein
MEKFRVAVVPYACVKEPVQIAALEGLDRVIDIPAEPPHVPPHDNVQEFPEYDQCVARPTVTFSV